MKLAKIRKSIVSEGRVLAIGEIVDISNWRNARSLVSARYVELVDSATSPVSETTDEVVVKEKSAKPKTKK